MDKIQIKNLRSLKNTEYLDIKPLTILVGRNSSGKSTFLRTFPLLKQTLATKKNEPILWYSKENVDFGSFEESLNRNKEEDFIGFNFVFESKIPYYLTSSNLPSKDKVKIEVRTDIKEKTISKIEIIVFDTLFVFEEVSECNEEYKVSINNNSIEKMFIQRQSNVFASFIPDLALKNEEDKIGESKLSGNEPSDNYFINLIFEYIAKKLTEATDHKDYKNKLKQDILSFFKILDLSDALEFKERKENFFEGMKSNLKKEENKLNVMYNTENVSESESFSEEEPENLYLKILENEDEQGIDFISSMTMGYFMNQIIAWINMYMDRYFSQVHYIAPLRASAQRYYRLQGLAVDEIDPQGENIPMAIKHLSDTESKNFKKWTEQNFGFQFETKPSGGHITLNISFGENESLNLADTGFGFSQILPIILLLWKVKSEEKNNSQRLYTLRFFGPIEQTIVIEQPELHLHPALQARLTDALARCIKEARRAGILINIIIETHSETIINRLGQLVFEDLIKKDDINILIFGESDQATSSESSIKSVSFNEEGRIEKWPMGFFYPEV